jgi:hypothetical protein
LLSIFRGIVKARATPIIVGYLPCRRAGLPIDGLAWAADQLLLTASNLILAKPNSSIKNFSG